MYQLRRMVWVGGGLALGGVFRWFRIGEWNAALFLVAGTNVVIGLVAWWLTRDAVEQDGSNG